MSDRRDGRVVLRARAIGRVFESPGGDRLEILRDLDFTLERGSVVAITGASGVGKSTLLNILGLLDRPTSGSIEIEGRRADTLTPAEVAGLRNRSVGFVFQFHHLLNDFDAVENVAIPAWIGGRVGREVEARAKALLKDVGLEARMNHRPLELSGGERQRVAIARALMNDPVLVLADEPTGNLDPETAQGVQRLLLDRVRNGSRSAVIVTHDESLAAKADLRLVLAEGRLHRTGESGRRVEFEA